MTGRCILDVIDAILATVPQTENALIKRLSVYKGTLWNIAPELLSDGKYFYVVALILQDEIPAVDTAWKLRVQKIFNGTDV
jgi:hypothetical protein